MKVGFIVEEFFNISGRQNSGDKWEMKGDLLFTFCQIIGKGE
jgi:hypothetical protein